MKYLIFIRLILCSFFFSSTAAQAGGTEKQEVIFVTQDFPPYSYIEDGQGKGFAVDMIRQSCEYLKWRCRIKFRPWVRALNELREGQYSAGFLLGRNKEREDWLRFSQPVVSTEYGFFVNTTDSLEYKQADDLQGYRIAVYGPSNTSHALLRLAERSGGLEVYIRPDDTVGFLQLDAKRVDAVYSNREVGLAMIRRLELKDIRYAGADRSLNYYVAFPKAFTEEKLIDQFNFALEEMQLKGRLEELATEYGLEVDTP